MPVVAGFRHGEVKDVARGSRQSGVRNPVVMEPRAKLEGMPVSKRVSGIRVSLGTDLDLLFQAELGRKRELCREILDEAGNRIQGLSVQRMDGREEESDRRNKDLTYVSAVPLVHRARPPNDTCPVGTTAARAA